MQWRNTVVRHQCDTAAPTTEAQAPSEQPASAASELPEGVTPVERLDGSENVADEEHFKIVSNAGGTLNGTTNSDRTSYFRSVPANQLETVLWLEADRMGFLTILTCELPLAYRSRQNEILAEIDRDTLNENAAGSIRDLDTTPPNPAAVLATIRSCRRQRFVDLFAHPRHTPIREVTRSLSPLPLRTTNSRRPKSTSFTRSRSASLIRSPEP